MKIENDPSPPTHSEDGVDLTLIRWFLTLTPAERLQVLQDHIASVMSMRGDQTSGALDLETLIETKEAAGRDKDLAVLAVLRRTLEERKKR